MPGKLSSLIGTIKRKPTTAPDRKTAEEAGHANQKRTSVLHDITRQLSLKEVNNLASALPALASGAPLDDRDLLLENGVAMLQGLPSNSGLSEATSNKFINMLWHDLPHPAVTVAGPTSRYRRHDGGNNNPWNPELGKAGSPYCRNVPPTKPKGPNLPDPELVFEQLLRRDGPFREHPSGLNRMFFSFATIVIHECFQTSRKDPWINETSSYVDLSTLYGNTEKEQTRVRTYNNGLIYPDSIASDRIMMMPPGVIAVLLMFSRNHNAIATDMLSINEEGKYKPWDTLDDEKKKAQDEDIFQITRNINVGFFASVVLKDYVAAILNTPRANSTWSLDLGKEIKAGGERVERGTGGVVSTEFAVLYHWHAALSAADADWMENVLRANLPELQSVDDMTPDMFHKVMIAEFKKLMSKPAKEWTFAGLERAPDGRFNDIELAEILKDCIEEPAHAFGAHGTPASLKIVDILGQMQARDLFNVCTLNEFRRYLNLKPYESFEDWNTDKQTARAAELLYGHIDNMELYPGLMAERTKPAMPGSGVCPGQTTGRGILDDAVALVRGDRFLSYDFNSNTLSNYGVGRLAAGVAAGAYGGVLPKLLFDGLPGAWPGTSTYVLLPFYTPEAAKGIVRGNKVAQQYETARPASDANLVSVHTHEACKKVLTDHVNFRVLGSAAGNKENPLNTIFYEDGFDKSLRKYFEATTAQLIKDSSLKYSNSRRSVDIVRDVTNVVPIKWLAQRFAIPLKTLETPRGLVSLPQLFDIYTVLWMHQTFNIVPKNEWALRDGASTAYPLLTGIHEAHLKTQSGVTEKVVDWLAKGSAYEVGPDADRVYKALNGTKQSVEDSARDCVNLEAPIAGISTLQASLIVDLYLRPEYAEYKQRIVELAHKDDDESWKVLQGFVWEGIRHAGIIPGWPRVATNDTVVQDGIRGPIRVKKNHVVVAATSKAAHDPLAFSEPAILNPYRAFSEYALLSDGPHFDRVVVPAVTAMLKQIFKLKNVRRAVGKQGHFSYVERELGGVSQRLYLDANSKENLIPTTFHVEYDDGAVLPVVNGTNGVNGDVHSTAQAAGKVNPQANGEANGVYKS